MSNTIDRVVPLFLEDYIALHGEPLKAPTRCSGCLKRPAVARQEPNDYCEVCWAGMQGHDQAEWKAVRVFLNAMRNAEFDERIVRHSIVNWLAEGGEA